MKKLAIFDLDGTLLNTIKDLGEAVNYALDRNGFHTHSVASYPYFVGNGVKRLIERALPEDARKKSSVVNTMLKDFKQYYNDARSKQYERHSFADLRVCPVGYASEEREQEQRQNIIGCHYRT